MGIDDMYLGSMPGENDNGFEMPPESDDGPPLESGTPLSHVVGREVTIVSSGTGEEKTRAALISAGLSALGFLTPIFPGLSASFAEASFRGTPEGVQALSGLRRSEPSLPAPSN